MTKKEIKNVPASVRSRLLNRARSENRPFNELLQYYSMERFLFRLSKSPHKSCFVLKGALMLRVWGVPEIRPTMDIDMLGRTSNDEKKIISQIKDILGTEVGSDGLIFDMQSIKFERITEDSEYQGIRVHFIVTLDSAKIRMQLDIGFGDIIFPGPELEEVPVMLDFPAPKVLCYSRESTIAEKFEAMVKLGELNSRMKDFYDIWLLARNYNFEGDKIKEAIRSTFEHRKTFFPNMIIAFEDSFAEGKQIQWSAFCRRLQLYNGPSYLKEVVLFIGGFLQPIVDAIVYETPSPKTWNAPGPWV